MKHLQFKSTSPPSAITASQVQTISDLADALCAELVKTDLPQRHQSLSVECIDLLIDLYPSCPRWASIAVDQINVQLERADELAI